MIEIMGSNGKMILINKDTLSNKEIIVETRIDEYGNKIVVKAKKDINGNLILEEEITDVKGFIL